MLHEFLEKLTQGAKVINIFIASKMEGEMEPKKAMFPMKHMMKKDNEVNKQMLKLLEKQDKRDTRSVFDEDKELKAEKYI